MSAQCLGATLPNKIVDDLRLMRLDRWGDLSQSWQHDPVATLQAGTHRLAAIVKSGIVQRFHILVIG